MGTDLHNLILYRLFVVIRDEGSLGWIRLVLYAVPRRFKMSKFRTGNRGFSENAFSVMNSLPHQARRDNSTCVTKTRTFFYDSLKVFSRMNLVWTKIDSLGMRSSCSDNCESPSTITAISLNCLPILQIASHIFNLLSILQIAPRFSKLPPNFTD